jgi:CRP/FNR family transcriptional regulator, nitrogen fixation regulation protein
MLQWRSETRPSRNAAFAATLQDAPTGQLAEVIGLMGACMKFDRGAEIFAEDEAAEYIYMVASGAVRLSKLLSDGRRQIGAFYLPGDIFGLEAEETHSFSAESICDSQVVLVKRSALVAEAVRDGEMARQLWGKTVGHLQRAQSHMLLLGRKNAQERIAAFLMEMAGRQDSDGSVELPMSRQDIADYLGLTIETVSRTLTQLERDGVISMPISRHIVFNDAAALDKMNDGWAA